MLDGRYLAANPSGIGRYCRQVVPAMVACRPELQLSYVVRQPKDARPLSSVATHTFDYPAYGPSTFLTLGRRLGPHPADLFHSPFHILPLGLRCPTVLTMHDVIHFNQRKLSNSRFPINW
ncbi:MAG: hypothetical protein JRI68_28050, partial [Deltaproteobacteria bacterium]|nr:hypothetical protein [Deltaproteobacteria bacterium]